jgi:hypothetical protein
MNEQLNDLDEIDLTFEISDEMLESAAGMEMGKLKAATLSFCSGLSVCPG